MLCETGDLLGVPAGTRHWFDMGTSPQFTAYSVGGHFTGANATAAAGAPPALAPDGAHFAQGTRSGALAST